MRINCEIINGLIIRSWRYLTRASRKGFMVWEWGSMWYEVINEVDGQRGGKFQRRHWCYPRYKTWTYFFASRVKSHFACTWRGTTLISLSIDFLRRGADFGPNIWILMHQTAVLIFSRYDVYILYVQPCTLHWNFTSYKYTRIQSLVSTDQEKVEKYTDKFHIDDNAVRGCASRLLKICKIILHHFLYGKLFNVNSASVSSSGLRFCQVAYRIDNSLFLFLQITKIMEMCWKML